ncbi:SseB family protein, partial [Micromonospora sp. NPDC051296]|uniref:SseB family protein n=1 Tax=Micromonospora sp. NPDC051296 TaxID=3155046 RepID=UPI003447D33F
MLLPVPPASPAPAWPGEEGFAWRTETRDAEPHVAVFTPRQRLGDHRAEPVETVDVKFAQLIRMWPDASLSSVVNPGSPVGATLPGAQIVALATRTADVGLADRVGGAPTEPAPAEKIWPRLTYAQVRGDPGQPIMMQKTIGPDQVDNYLKRGHDRVSGFVHRAHEVAHLTTPATLHAALGLDYEGSPLRRDADETHVLRWPAHRPSLYRIPHGGQNDIAMLAMEGW